MKTEIDVKRTPQEEFQTRIARKLKKDIGKLLPDEVLANMVERAMEQQFFNARPAEYNQYHQETSPEKCSWFVEEVSKVAKTQIEHQVAMYVASNSEHIKKATTKFLDEQNLMLMGIAAIQAKTQIDWEVFANEIVTRIKQGY